MAASPSSVGNPFSNSIHANPWTDPTSNVPQIGNDAFRVIQAELEQVRRQNTSRSVLIFGAPGCGKTHLIARIRLFLIETAGRRSFDSVFVAVQMHTAPGRIWRHIRYRLMDDLLRVSPTGRSQMDGLVFRLLSSDASSGIVLNHLKQAIGEGASRDDSTGRALADALYAAVNHLDGSGELRRMGRFFCDRLAGEEFMPPALKTVLLHIVHRRHIGFSHAWLRGDSLPDADIQTLGVPPPDDEDPEGDAREFVFTLLRLIGPGTPVVFCFDQTEVLQSEPGDIAGFFSFGNAAGALHDRSTNALLLTFIQSIFVDTLKGAIGSNFDRIGQRRAELPGLNQGQASALIEARLSGIKKSQAGHIKMEDFAGLFASTGLAAPRQIIARAAQLYDQRGEESADEVIASRWEQLREVAETGFPSNKADEILEHGLPILLRLGGRDAVPGSRSGMPIRDIQLSISDPSGIRGVSICNQKNMRSLERSLRRLKSGAIPASRLVLVRDASLPISRRAKRTVEHLDELTKNGARLVRASAEMLAALEALRLLITAAKAGELAHGGSSIEPKTVEQWLSSRLPASLNELVSQLAGEAPPPNSALSESLVELVGDQLLITLSSAAGSLQSSERELIGCALANSSVVGYLSGPPALLFQRVAEGTA